MPAFLVMRGLVQPGHDEEVQAGEEPGGWVG